MGAKDSGIVFLPERVKQCRKEAGGVRNIDIVNATGSTVKHISGVLTGKSAVSYRLGLVIAEKLNTTVGFLTGVDGNPAIAKKSESAEMFARLMKCFAAVNPDLVLHFRDIDKKIDSMAPEEIQVIADGLESAINKVLHEIKKKHQE